MREEVIDSSFFVGALLKSDEHYSEAMLLIEDLHKGRCLFHISTLIPVEVCGAIIRRTKSSIQAYEARKTLEDWIKEGKVKIYELDEQRMNLASEIAIRDRLKGADAVIAEISEELKIPLRTFDKEILRRFKGKQP